MDFQLLNVLSADVLRNSLHQLGILDSLVHMTVLFLLIGEYMILRMIKSLLHLLFQLCHDLRQCFTALKLPAYCQMKASRILALYHSIQLIGYQQIIAIYIVKQKQRLSGIQIQIEKYSPQFLTHILCQILICSIKKILGGFHQNGTVPLIPGIQVNHFSGFFQNFFFSCVNIILEKILLEKILFLLISDLAVFIFVNFTADLFQCFTENIRIHRF